jgi:hypothetical protein
MPGRPVYITKCTPPFCTSFDLCPNQSLSSKLGPSGPVCLFSPSTTVGLDRPVNIGCCVQVCSRIESGETPDQHFAYLISSSRALDFTPCFQLLKLTAKTTDPHHRPRCDLNHSNTVWESSLVPRFAETHVLFTSIFEGSCDSRSFETTHKTWLVRFILSKPLFPRAVGPLLRTSILRSSVAGLLRRSNLACAGQQDRSALWRHTRSTAQLFRCYHPG